MSEGEMMGERLNKLAWRWFAHEHLHEEQKPCWQCRMLIELLASYAAEARLDEAKWWRYLVQMHDESYFAVEGDKRIAELQRRSASQRRRVRR